VGKGRAHQCSMSTNSMGYSALTRAALRPDSTSAFSRRDANYFACFFWIATTRINYFYWIAHNSKETGEIFRISPRKCARGIRPLDQCCQCVKLFSCGSTRSLRDSPHCNFRENSLELIIEPLTQHKQRWFSLVFDSCTIQSPDTIRSLVSRCLSRGLFRSERSWCNELFRYQMYGKEQRYILLKHLVLYTIAKIKPVFAFRSRSERVRKTFERVG
jgi:hypothetical protein